MDWSIKEREQHVLDQEKWVQDLLSWVVVLVGVAVYLIYRRGRKARESDQAQSRFLRIQEVVKGYGAFLGKIDLAPGDVRDVAELPYPKQEIIKSCLVAIRLSEAHSKERSALESGLMCVAQFQPGVGEPICHPGVSIVANAKPMKARSSEEMTNDELEETLSLAREMVALGSDEKQSARRGVFMEMVDQDLQNLIQKIHAAR